MSKPGHHVRPPVRQRRRRGTGTRAPGTIVVVRYCWNTLHRSTPAWRADVLLHLRRAHGLVAERLLQPAQDAAPLVVVVHDLADGVQHVAALVVHVAGSLGVHAVGGDDRAVVLDVLRGSRSRTARPPPSPAGTPRTGSRRSWRSSRGSTCRRGPCRDAVAPPLMRALVHDDEVPLQCRARCPTGRGPGSRSRTVAVGHGALVLHAQMGRFDQLVAVRVPRIRAEPVLEALQHRLRLRQLPLGGLQVIGQRPEVDRERRPTSPW